MSDIREMLVDTAARLLGDHLSRDVAEAAEQGAWPAALWAALGEAGLTAAATSEARGGAGADLVDVAALLRTAGALAAPVPLAETLLAERMLAAAGLPPVDGPLTVGPILSGDALTLAPAGEGWTVSGTLHRVPWARDAVALVAVADCGGRPATVVVARPPVAAADWNLAREPRDTVRMDGHALPAGAVGKAGEGFDRDRLRHEGALFRAVQMAGAMQTVLDLTVEYALQRIQFGRPIGKFQAVQQQIAVLATQAAAAAAAASGAVEALAAGDGRFEIAAAKARVGEAAGIVAEIAHQVHGAIGFTHEHSLHRATRRLWSWRDEFGAEAEWYARVGAMAARVGGEDLWAFVTASAGH